MVHIVALILLICTNLAAGAKLIYLPLYSPDFSPIEQAFHSVKALLWRHEAEAVLPKAHPWLIQQAAMSITVADVVIYYRWAIPYNNNNNKRRGR